MVRVGNTDKYKALDTNERFSAFLNVARGAYKYELIILVFKKKALEPADERKLGFGKRSQSWGYAIRTTTHRSNRDFVTATRIL